MLSSRRTPGRLHANRLGGTKPCAFAAAFVSWRVSHARGLLAYAELAFCRSAPILRYFGEEAAAVCGRCDNRDQPRAWIRRRVNGADPAIPALGTGPRTTLGTKIRMSKLGHTHDPR